MPSQCILIDDRDFNLECARELGMQTVLYKNLSQLRDELARFDIVIEDK